MFTRKRSILVKSSVKSLRTRLDGAEKDDLLGERLDEEELHAEERVVLASGVGASEGEGAVAGTAAGGCLAGPGERLDEEELHADDDDDRALSAVVVSAVAATAPSCVLSTLFSFFFLVCEGPPPARLRDGATTGTTARRADCVVRRR